MFLRPIDSKITFDIIESYPRIIGAYPANYGSIAIFSLFSRIIKKIVSDPNKVPTFNLCFWVRSQHIYGKTKDGA